MTRGHHSLWEYVIRNFFSEMRLGSMKMTLPGGQEIFYGSYDPDSINADIRVKDAAFFRKTVLFGDVGFGESFVDGDWETSDIFKVIAWMILNIDACPALAYDRPGFNVFNLFWFIDRLGHSKRRNTLNGSQRNIQEHYDLSNDFFALFLDPTRAYSCAYYRTPDMSLEQAQREKYAQWCRKLRISSGDKIIEIGSGWGGFAVYAARNHGCHVTTVTISKAQFDYVKELVVREGLDGRVEVHLSDYRHLEGQFDKLISIEMIEAVGHHFLKDYIAVCQKLVRPDGILGIQGILCPDHRYESFRKRADWTQKHIFPGSVLPSMARIMNAFKETGAMGLWDHEDITPFYSNTLLGWRENFRGKAGEIKSMGFDEFFIRKWEYYFSYCAAAFHMRNIHVAQMVFTRANHQRLPVYIS
jgi:cyclopropane-fatty-acyl-phospholipid synthase